MAGDPGASDPAAGAGEAASALMQAFYGAVVKAVVPVSSNATAEAVKLTENVFRAVNIALVNELKVLYDAMGIDIWEVVEAAKTKPFGYMPFYPGPGLGGHCIPIDPFYLTWKAREFSIATRFIELAGEINTNMPRHVIERLIEAMDSVHQRGLQGSRVLLVGLAYKKNVDDVRESPSLRLMEMLEARGASVDYFDPYVPEIPRMREHPRLEGRRCVACARSREHRRRGKTSRRCGAAWPRHRSCASSARRACRCREQGSCRWSAGRRGTYPPAGHRPTGTGTWR